MTYTQIKDICRRGKIGLIPKWTGYLKWDYSKNEIYFQNENYIMTQAELEGNYGIANRDDLYYII